LDLNKTLNVIVGDNETGKSTLLEAINLVLSYQLEGRSIQYELNPYIFNGAIVRNYFNAIKNGENPSPPQILIEAYLDDVESGELSKLKGTNNTAGEDCPGLYLKVVLNDDFTKDFMDYTHADDNPCILPTEYYTIVWRSFADNSVATRNLPFRAKIIDTSLVRGYIGPNKYLSRIINDVLEDDNQRLSMSLAYRKLKYLFMNEDGIKKVNAHLANKKGDVTEKTLTVSMDMSARSTWDSSITAHLDDIPFDLIGKGEQCRVQMKLAIEAAGDSNVLLIEEPENHLSHSNMCKLLDEITQRGADRQVILTTHSNFVLNKLGIDNVKLLSSGKTMTLSDLSPDTKDYFMKLPGYDTLRLILSFKTILVEGPSDELIVQKAYKKQHGKLPIENGIDVITVGSLAFKRFLEIGKLLNLDIRVVTDNDGNVDSIKEKYRDYLGRQAGNIKIYYDTDENYPTLEPQLLKANSLDVLNGVLGKDFTNENDLLNYMDKNKTDIALKIFNSDKLLTFPSYIQNAVI
jgi:ABC-type multidrug transport system ATPase subunit